MRLVCPLMAEVPYQISLKSVSLFVRGRTVLFVRLTDLREVIVWHRE
jgi:hypothetical protein